MTLLILSIFFFIFDSSNKMERTVEYDTIEYNIVIDEHKKVKFKQFVFWKDGCSQGYTIQKQEEFVDGPIKSGPYHVIIVKYKGIYYFLKSKTMIKSVTNYDVELKDLKETDRTRKYNVRWW